MYYVLTEKRSAVFGEGYWHRIIGPHGMLFQAYLNESEANNVCLGLNQVKRISDRDLAIIRSKTEEKRLEKIANKS